MPANMKLSVGDRLILLGVIPQQGDFTTLKIVRNMRDELSFSEEEHKKLKFRQEGEMMHWGKGVKNKKIDFLILYPFFPICHLSLLSDFEYLVFFLAKAQFVSHIANYLESGKITLLWDYSQ